MKRQRHIRRTPARYFCGTGLALLIVHLARLSPAAGPAARELFREGNAALSQGAYTRALALFVRSFEQHEHDSTLLNIAQCYRLLHLPDLALRRYLDYLALSQSKRGRPRFAADVRRYVNLMQRVIQLNDKGNVQHRAGQLEQALETFRRARTLIPWPRVDLGMASVLSALGRRAEAARAARRASTALQKHFEEWAAELPAERLPHRRQLERDLAHARRLLAEAEQTGLARRKAAALRVEGIPRAATVYVDGRAVASGPSATLQLPPGSHQLAVAFPGAQRWSRVLQLHSGSTTTLKPQLVLQPVSRPATCTACLISGIAAGALAVAAEITAIVLSVQANKLYSNDPDFGSLRAGNVTGHAVAGAAALTSGISFFFYWRSLPAKAPP